MRARVMSPCCVPVVAGCRTFRPRFRDAHLHLLRRIPCGRDSGRRLLGRPPSKLPFWEEHPSSSRQPGYSSWPGSQCCSSASSRKAPSIVRSRRSARTRTSPDRWASRSSTSLCAHDGASALWAITESRDRRSGGFRGSTQQARRGVALESATGAYVGAGCSARVRRARVLLG